MWLVYLFTILLGLCIGSFLNVVIYRVPNGLSVVKPNSHCPNCKKEIKWYDNIPVLSYMILRGRCRNCKEPISIRYALVEIFNTILYVLCVFCFWSESILLAILSCIVCSILLVVALIDLEHLMIFDRFIIALLLVGIVASVFTTNVSYIDRIIGFFAGGGVLLLFYGLGYLLFKKEALGIGDIKLMAVCGLFIGYQNVLFALFAGAIIGAITLLLINKKEKGREYPFAPFLCFGVLLALFCGDAVINFYLSLF